MVIYQTQRIMPKAKTCSRPELTNRIQEAMEKHVPQKNNAALQAQSGVCTLCAHLESNTNLDLIEIYHNALVDLHRNHNI